MVMRSGWLFLSLLLGVSDLLADAEKPDFRLFGSVGNETHLVAANPDSRLNPGNFLRIPSASNSLDFNLFTELVPESKAWKLHFKIRGENDWNRDDSVTRVEVSEAAFSVSVAPWIDLQVGRTIEKWGTGYAWNPTGVVNPRKNPSDPNDRRGAYRGVDNIRVDCFVKDWNLAVLAVPEINWRGQDGKHLLSSGWAFRAYRLVKGIDLSLTASGGSGLPNSQGLSLSGVLGNALELHGEVAVFGDSLRMRPESANWVLQSNSHADVLVGGQYTFPRSVNLIIEYYHAGNGLSPAEWAEYERMVNTGLESFTQGNAMPLLICNRQFSALGMARDYMFGRLYWLFHHDKLEAELLVLSSARDGSALVRPGISWKIARNWSIYWLQSELIGGTGTEFGHLQVRRMSDFGLRFHF